LRTGLIPNILTADGRLDGVDFMRNPFTLEFWRDGAFYVGRLLEVPGVFSQGETMMEFRENIQDAFDLMTGN
jgi:hypothetical protein